MSRFRTVVILTHRYLGIPLSFVFVIWLASGIVMMYAGGMPSLTPAARLAHLAPLDGPGVDLRVLDGGSAVRAQADAHQVVGPHRHLAGDLLDRYDVIGRPGPRHFLAATWDWTCLIIRR